ncbi:unnamed protein product [Rotaria socialis]|uniref:Uncharacterized protein n=1 Tax=Rotaria socialis TaxID=392032 RepID=A0A821FDX1_9BILA|nr:unnamed protein product [Rotaria socialis]CAF4646866.1 unnamed protein product [Rotaria socialis]
MKASDNIWIKTVVLIIVFILIFYYASFQINHYGLKTAFTNVYRSLNKTRLLEMFISAAFTPMANRTSTIMNNSINFTFTTMMRPINFNTSTTILQSSITTTTTGTTTSRLSTISTTTTTGRPTTLDPAFLLVERPPLPSSTKNKTIRGSLAVFIFHTHHHVLADLQLYLIQKLTTDLVAINLFTDGKASEDMHKVAKTHRAEVFSFLPEQHSPKAGPSEKNAEVVNWAVSTRAKRYLSNGTAILLLDGDVFPLSPFDSQTLLNSRDLMCRKHPVLFSRFCWIGFICLGPQLFSTIDEFDVSPTSRQGIGFDSGGKTIDYLLKYENISFSWMKETILLNTDKDLFWGAINEDIRWIGSHFDRCDKCGPEVFFSPFDSSNAVFYHMISATSEWRFGHQSSRRKSIYEAVMGSPYGPNKKLVTSDIMASVKKIQKMETIPFSGNLSCAKVCKGK